MKNFLLLFILMLAFVTVPSRAQTNGPVGVEEELNALTRQLATLKEQRSKLDRTIADNHNRGLDATAGEAELATLNETIRPLMEKQARLRAQATAARKASASTNVEPQITSSISLPTEPEVIRVVSIVGNYGFLRCLTDKGELLISGLPASIPKHFTDLKQLEDRVERLAEEVRITAAEARRADAVAPTYAYGNPDYVNQQMALRERANLLAADAKNQNADLKVLQRQLLTLQKQTGTVAAILATQTTQKYIGLNVWRYQGPAPQPPKDFANPQ